LLDRKGEQRESKGTSPWRVPRKREKIEKNVIERHSDQPLPPTVQLCMHSREHVKEYLAKGREKGQMKKRKEKKKIYIYIYIYITNAWHVQRLQTLKERGESEREREAASQVEQELCNEITFAT
jgi:hypothetical protein